jgi:hypothetical protein
LEPIWSSVILDPTSALKNSSISSDSSLRVRLLKKKDNEAKQQKDQKKKGNE